MVNEILKELNGKVVENNGKALAALILADAGTLRHTGNFCFEATKGGKRLTIHTEPAYCDDEEYKFIRITSIVSEYGEAEIFGDNIIRKAHITYKMLRGEHEVAETCVDLPISAARYKELAAGLTPESKPWNTVRDALLNLTYLQGYDELGAWDIELTIEG
jgi:hypothetical protein